MKRDWCHVCIADPVGQRWLCPNIENHPEVEPPDASAISLCAECSHTFLGVDYLCGKCRGGEE